LPTGRIELDCAYILRGNGLLLKDVIEGRMKGSRTQGRKRVGMLDDLIGGRMIWIDKEKTARQS